MIACTIGYATFQGFLLPAMAEIRETRFMVSRPRPLRPMGWSRHQDQDRDSNFQSLKTKTHWDQRISKLSRPRLDNLVVVETETHRDWMKIVKTKTLTRLFEKVLENSANLVGK